MITKIVDIDSGYVRDAYVDETTNEYWFVDIDTKFSKKTGKPLGYPTGELNKKIYIGNWYGRTYTLYDADKEILANDIREEIKHLQTILNKKYGIEEVED